MAQEIATTESADVQDFLKTGKLDYVTFTIKGQLFGIPILDVQDILSLDKIASIPLAPPKVRGSINLRGKIVTVIGVRQCLGIALDDAEAADANIGKMGVTVEKGHDLNTLMVDSIGEVVTVDSANRENPPSTLGAVWKKFAMGVYRLEKSLMLILDVEQLLDLSEEFY
jgi:purine-binding chemotaxis protein CheW